MVAGGAEAGFNFLVMTLCGPSIHQLHQHAPLGYLSLGTVARITIQALEALEDLHEAGFLHRDIKPVCLRVTVDLGFSFYFCV